MNAQRFAPSDSSSKNSARGVPFRILLPLPRIARHLCPRQSRGPGGSSIDGYRIGPPTCGGTAVIGEATDGDGDENSSREQRLTILEGTAKKTRCRKHKDEIKRIAKRRLY